jgi:hypothetical protein
MPDRTTHRLDARGTVRDWLVAGAWPEPADDLDRLVAAHGSPWGADGRWVLTNGPDVTPLKRRLHAARPLRRDQPLPEITEGGEVAYTGPTGIVHQGHWRRVHTAADGLVDWSEFCFTPEYRLALAGCLLEVDQAERRRLRLACTGPTLLYVGGRCASADETVTYMEPAEHEVDVWLPSGTTSLLVASWQVAFRECRQVLRLRVDGLPVRVVIPSPGADERVSAIAEQVLDAVGTPTWGTPTASVTLTGPDGAALRVGWNGRTRRVRMTGGRATLELDRPAEAAEAVEPPDASGDVGTASMLATGEVSLRVTLDDDRSPVFRELPVAVLPRPYRAEPSGDPSRWRAEFLAHAAGASGTSATELARAALDPRSDVRPASLDRALWMIDNRADCADFEAVGLIHLWHRVPESRWPAGLRERVRAALLGFKYWIDQPGLDAMCYFTENHQLVWHTAETLAPTRGAACTARHTAARTFRRCDRPGWRRPHPSCGCAGARAP